MCVKKTRESFSIKVSRDFLLLQEAGLEPALCCHNRHLKPARLPIPPLLRIDLASTKVMIHSFGTQVNGFFRDLRTISPAVFIPQHPSQHQPLSPLLLLPNLPPLLLYLLLHLAQFLLLLLLHLPRYLQLLLRLLPLHPLLPSLPP